MSSERFAGAVSDHEARLRTSNEEDSAKREPAQHMGRYKAAHVINKFRVQDNGRTAELTTRHTCKDIVIGFAEKVHFQHSQVDKNQYKKDVGMFLGMIDRCNTNSVGTSEGIYASPLIM